MSSHLPRTILLASDLTSRGDRARDRAWQLARDWRAALHVVHVVAPPPAAPAGIDPEVWSQRHDEARQDALRLIRRDILAGELEAQVHVEQDESPARAILAVAERAACDAIVLGETRDGLGRSLGEGTIDEVMRRSPASVLVVRDRPHGPYQHLLVGTDFTDEALQALEHAARVFPDATLTLMHAASVPYGALLGAKPDTREQWAAGQLEQLRRQLAAADIDEERRTTIHLAVEDGPAGPALARYVRAQGADLAVIGAHPRGTLFDTFVGTTRSIVAALPGDVLMVRATRG
jgi:nucleotide-binding universal stress UspA family protein